MIILYSFLFYIMFCGINSFKLTKNLDDKTKYVDDDRYFLSLRYVFLFLYGNIFCMLFIKQIRRKRKIEYLTYYINFRESSFTEESNKKDKKLFLYKRLLKLEKLK